MLRPTEKADFKLGHHLNAGHIIWIKLDVASKVCIAF
jgi:hypothetical protein